MKKKMGMNKAAQMPRGEHKSKGFGSAKGRTTGTKSRKAGAYPK